MLTRILAIGAVTAGVSSVMMPIANAACIPRIFTNVPLCDDDLFNFTFNSEPDGLNGDDSGNVIEGTPFPDTIFGFGGNDTIYGNVFEPFDNGHFLDDRINGGPGNDRIEAREGYDIVRGALGNDRIYGGLGNDALFGDGGDDTILGGSDRDLVVGGSGKDTLKGEGGRDDIYGGLDADIMTGGGDVDTFHLRSAAESGVGAALRDRITDLAVTEKIDLSEIDAIPGPGNQAFTFRGAAPFNGVGQVRVTVVGGNRIVSGNVDADLAAEFEIQIDGNGFALTAANFVL